MKYRVCLQYIYTIFTLDNNVDLNLDKNLVKLRQFIFEKTIQTWGLLMNKCMGCYKLSYSLMDYMHGLMSFCGVKPY